MRTFASRTFKARTFAVRTLAGGGDTGKPTAGWVARESSRTVTGGLSRVVASPEMNRVVVAYPEGRCHGMR